MVADASEAGAATPAEVERRLQRALVAAACALLPLAGALYLTLPSSPDQLQLDYTGWLINQGQIPYVDFLDGNWPAAHWIHALSVRLFGTGLSTFRAFDMLLLVPTVAAGALLCFRAFGRSSAIWFVLLYPCLYVVSDSWFAGQRDIIAGHLCLIAMAGLWEQVCEGRPLGGAVAGVAVTLATLVKPTFALMAPMVLAAGFVLVAQGLVGPRAATRAVGRVAGWSAATLLAGIVVLEAQGSSLPAFWEHAVVSILMRVPNEAGVLGTKALESLSLVFRWWHFIVAGAGIAVVRFVGWGDARERAGVALLALVALTGAASYAAQVHGLTYYLGPIYTSLVVLLCAALGWATGIVARERGWLRIVALVGILIVVAGTARKWQIGYGDVVRIALGRATWDDYHARFSAGDGLDLVQARQLAAELEPHLTPGGTLLVWGRANVLNLLTHTSQPTAFYHNLHVERAYLPRDMLDRWTRQLHADLAARPPDACVVEAVPTVPGSPARAEIDALLAERYRAVRRVGSSILYLPRDATPPASAPQASEPSGERSERARGEGVREGEAPDRSAATPFASGESR